MIPFTRNGHALAN